MLWSFVVDIPITRAVCIHSSLTKIIVTGYRALQLIYFFTAGKDEVKAWTIQKGTKAPQAAGRIHTDFEKGFIMAEVMHFEDFKEAGSEAAAKVCAYVCAHTHVHLVYILVVFV